MGALATPRADTDPERSPLTPRAGSVQLLSFGFKFGPPAANYSFDVSFIKNPARDDRWGMHGVIDPEMVDFVLRQEPVARFVDLVVPLVRHVATVDAFQVVAFGCNAGRHRSPI